MNKEEYRKLKERELAKHQPPTVTKPTLFRGVVAKTFSFLNRFVPTTETGTGDKKHYQYGLNDLLPNDNLKLINDCGVAKRCVRKKARYIQGDGFADENVADMPVNATQTADGLLRHIASYAAYNEGFALSIRRNAEAKIVEVKCLPFECVRKNIDGTFLYNPAKGQPNYDQKKDTRHPAFNPYISVDEYRQNLIDFKQQPEIFYIYEQTADNPHYPVPDYNAGLEDIQTCVEISKVDLECVQNGFMPSGILTTNEIDDVNKDGEPDANGNRTGHTPYEYFVEELKKFTGQTKDQNGMSGRFKLFHIMVSNMAEAPKLDTYDAKSILEASNSKRDIIAREVCRLFGVNPILVGFSDAAVLGNQQALANTIAELNNYVNSIQRMITEAFTTLFPQNDWTITQFNPITYIPAEVWAKMTDDEIRGVVGLEPIDTGTPSESQKTLEALNTLSPLVANKVLDSMTTNEIRALVNMPALTPDQIAELMPPTEPEPPKP